MHRRYWWFSLVLSFNFKELRKEILSPFTYLTGHLVSFSLLYEAYQKGAALETQREAWVLCHPWSGWTPCKVSSPSIPKDFVTTLAHEFMLQFPHFRQLCVSTPHAGCFLHIPLICSNTVFFFQNPRLQQKKITSLKKKYALSPPLCGTTISSVAAPFFFLL